MKERGRGRRNGKRFTKKRELIAGCLKELISCVVKVTASQDIG